MLNLQCHYPARSPSPSSHQWLQDNLQASWPSTWEPIPSGLPSPAQLLSPHSSLPRWPPGSQIACGLPSWMMVFLISAQVVPLPGLLSSNLFLHMVDSFSSFKAQLSYFSPMLCVSGKFSLKSYRLHLEDPILASTPHYIYLIDYSDLFSTRMLTP